MERNTKILRIDLTKKKNATEEVNEPPINKLNNDCLLNILNHLSFKDRLTAEEGTYF